MNKYFRSVLVTTLLFVQITPCISFAQSAEAEKPIFTDVPNTHENYVAIKFLKDLKVIGGYDDGSFKPNAKVNRAEALKFILVGTGTEVKDLTKDPTFSDVKKADWFAKYIMNAKDQGVVTGNPDGSFKPSTIVNRSAFIKMLLMANKFQPEGWKPSKQYADIKESDWFYKYMTYAGVAGLLKEDAKGNLAPSKELTRAEVAEIMYLMTIIRNGSNQKLLMQQTESQLVQIDTYVNATDLVSAKRASELAVDLTQQLIKLSPTDVTILGLAKIAKAYDFVLTAFIAGVQKNYDLSKDYALKAIAKATEAVGVDPKVKTIAEYIQKRAQEVLNQLPKK